jgi:hypothetical protein
MEMILYNAIARTVKFRDRFNSEKIETAFGCDYKEFVKFRVEQFLRCFA